MTNNLESAINAYNEAIRLKPDYAEAYNNRGAAKSGLGQHGDAIVDYNKAIRLKPNYVEAYNNRGNAKNHLGQREEAIADYDEAIRLKPDYAEAYINRGNVNNNFDLHEAIADYDRAIELKPGYAATYYNRGDTYFRLGRKDEARRDFETALALALKTGIEAMADKARQALERLFGEGGP